MKIKGSLLELVGIVLFHVFTLGLFIKANKKKLNKQLIEVKTQIENEKRRKEMLLKVDELCNSILLIKKCNNCKQPAKLISKELKYCNKCGFTFNHQIQFA